MITALIKKAVAQEKKNKQAARVIPKQETVPEKKAVTPQAPADIVIKYPPLLLALAALVVYIPTFYFGFTELDDSIFIRDFHAYNEDWSNLAVSFTRGLFNATKDPYYRPIFADSMLINYQLFKDNIAGYHFINVLLHITSVVLLYKVFTRLSVKPMHAFIITLIFAVHPVLSQAVAWIPGRNDTMLAVFAFAFLIHVIDYINNQKIASLLLSIMFLLLAFFTKETAVFIAPAAFVLLLLYMRKEWLSKAAITLYATWVVCFIVWYVARAKATIQPSSINAGNALTDLLHRLPLIWQYLGKIFLPVNLSVFPIQQDTSDIPGIIAIVLLAAILYFSKNVNWRKVGAGAAVFMLFLLPALLVPNNLNEQSFEHRLYLPIVGILLILPQTMLLAITPDRRLLLSSLTVCAVLAVVNYNHQRNFKDPVSFWTQAAETSPHSAYANMMLGAREDDVQKSYALFRKAYQLNPHEKYLNFYYGKMLQMQDSVVASGPHLLEEKRTSGYYECDFYLARVDMQKGDTTAALNDLLTYLKKDPTSANANINVLLMYYTRGKIPEATAQARRMLQMGLKVPPQVLQQLNIH